MLDKNQIALLQSLRQPFPVAPLAAEIDPSMALLADPTEHTMIQPDQPDAVVQLFKYWQQAHPEAGDKYWTVRSWTMLTWQPVALALISAFGSQQLISFSHFQQRLKQGLVSGFYWAQPLEEYSDLDPINRVLQLSAELNTLFQHYLLQLTQCGPLQHSVAMRLVKDQLAKMILQLAAMMPAGAEALAEPITALWCQSLQINTKPAYLNIPLAENANKTVVKRSACCLHYYRDDGDFCLTCPKQNKQQWQHSISQYQQLHGPK
ncbi:siderophore ferric iron reductase [Motilimonas pumila]|uniref:Siderophore ferric iron reductase n=1 Tax=Motilimonas pumila TaxID=2303987 RepID=A0A418YED5_9GAMM|nr:siderophore ferric iron reductase [Motilimonas pumila]RJG47508.1 siderophore ferric iron reductase [Motilimonas pumila]